MSHDHNQRETDRLRFSLRRRIVAAAGLLALCTATASAAAPIRDVTDDPIAGLGALARADDGSPVSVPPASGTDLISEGTDASGQIVLTVNKTVVVSTRQPYGKISIGSPDIADINTLGPTTVLVTAKKPGSTQLIVWDDANHSQVVEVHVSIDVKLLQKQLDGLFPGDSIKAEAANDAIVLRGRVRSLADASKAEELAQHYLPKDGPKVIDCIEVYGGQQVMLQVRFAEVDRTVSTELGMNVGFTDGVATGANNVGLNLFDNGSSTGNLSLVPPSGIASNTGITLFGSGMFGRTAIDVFVDALRENQLLRVLAEPNLMALSGQNADFLAGGSFPIPVVQGGGTSGGTSVTIQYQEYGVKLNFIPIVLGDGRIRLKVSPEVSDLDYANAVTLQGFKVPALTDRKLDTTIELSDGQTFALAGLLKNNQTASKDITPMLGDVPVLGMLFQSVKYQRAQTELVVLVTPRLVEPMNPKMIPEIPGENWRDPTEFQLYTQRDLGSSIHRGAKPTTRPAGTDADASQSAPLYHGNYGFSSDATAQTPVDSNGK
jgi:pilus assembly protein CpaC